MSTVRKLVDKNGTPLAAGDQVRFHSSRGSVMKAVVESSSRFGVMAEIRIGQDPFPTMVDHRQLVAVKRGRNDMPTRSAPATSAKELRRTAKSLRIEGWEEMSREELAEAIAENGTNGDSEVEAPPARRARKATKATAKKAPRKSTRTATATTRTAKKAPAKKAAAKKAAGAKKAAPRPPADPDTQNPFRPSTNLWYLAEALIKGGKRSTLVKQLRPKLKFAPRVQKEKDFDVDFEIDKRLKVVSYVLAKDYGFERILEGRGVDSFIQATPPA